MESWREELYHYGILGMKWGVRRYQNADGSLTEAGRKHYAKDLKKANRLDELKSMSNSGRRNYSRKAAKAQIKVNKAQTNLRKLKSKEEKLQNKSDALTSKYKSQESNFHLGKARQTYEQKLKVDAKLSKMQSKVAKGEAKANAALAKLNKQENGTLEFKRAAQKYAAKGEILTEKMIKKYGLTKAEINQDKADLKAGKMVDNTDVRLAKVYDAKYIRSKSQNDMDDGYDGYMSNISAKEIIKDNNSHIAEWKNTVASLKSNSSQSDKVKSAIKEYQESIKTLEKENRSLNTYLKDPDKYDAEQIKANRQAMVDEYNANKSDYDSIAKDMAKESKEIAKAERAAAKSNHEHATGVVNIMKTNHVDYDTAVKMYEEKKRRR